MFLGENQRFWTRNWLSEISNFNIGMMKILILYVPVKLKQHTFNLNHIGWCLVLSCWSVRLLDAGTCVPFLTVIFAHLLSLPYFPIFFFFFYFLLPFPSPLFLFFLSFFSLLFPFSSPFFLFPFSSSFLWNESILPECVDTEYLSLPKMYRKFRYIYPGISEHTLSFTFSTHAQYNKCGILQWCLQ